MKRFLSLLFVTCLLSSTVLGQQIHKCYTDELNLKRILNDPSFAAELARLDSARTAALAHPTASPRSVRTVSVAVHVVYNTAAENIPLSYLTTMIATMNKDYNKQNSDTSSVRSAFRSEIGNAQIEFCLDTVFRVHTANTCFDPNTQSDDMKSSATGGSDTYNPTQDLNIWICSICGSSVSTGGIAGYTYLPTTGVPGSATDGVVLDYGLAFINAGADRVATHETGHYFNLEHPWGNGNIGTCGDDGIADTPITDGTPGGCPSSQNNCGAPSPGALIEDFMDYADCPHMFTTDQATVMNTCLSGVRASLLSSSGCSSHTSGQGPTAAFSADRTVVCLGSTVHFTDASSGSPTQWSWTFDHGTPATSANQNPAVTYNTAGTFNVTLTVTNANGSNTSTQTGYITVLGSSALPLTQGFQGTTFPPTGWQVLNPDNDTTWTRTTAAGGYGTSTASAKMNCYDDANRGTQDFLVSPNYSFTGVSNAYLKFDYAYARYDATGTSDDTLYVLFSNNCGDSLYVLEVKAGATFATAPTTTAAFVPTSAQWRTDSINLGFLAGQSSVEVGFLTVNEYGNNIYLDNINISTAAATAPVVDFSGTPTTVTVGGTVNFTDLSTNSPTRWGWNFQGAATTTSHLQNPTGIQYNTVGTWSVTLTDTNAVGSASKTKTGYIHVVASAPSGCDTLSNIAGTDTLAIYLADSIGDGYLSGHNVYGDLAKADVFSPPVTGDQLTGALFLFGVADFSSASSSITVNAWDATGTGGAPGNVIATQTLYIDSIHTTGYTYVAFPTPPTINSTFYVGITFTYNAGDTVALYTNKLSASHTTTTGWEQNSAGTWGAYNGANDWGPNAILSNAIFPILCSVGGPVPVASFSANNTTICAGSTVTFTDHSTNSPNSWNWSFPGGTPTTSQNQNPTVTYTAPGQHSVYLTATNANGSGHDTLINYITVTAAPSATAVVTNVHCPGGSDGAISVSATGGTSPYHYNWNTHDTVPNLTNLAPGTYKLTITDHNGCIDTLSKTVTQPFLISMSVVPTPATCGNNNGSAVANAAGGTPPFTYAWSNAATGSSISGLAPNTYTVTATDANQCTKVASVTVTGTLGVTVGATPAATTCGQNNGTVNTSVSGGTPPYTYAWSNGQTSNNIASLPAGNYSVTVNDNGGCTASTSASVTGSTSITVTASATNANCGQTNGKAVALATGGAGYSYHWNNGQATDTASNLGAGNYSVTVTATGGCTASATASVSSIGGPAVTVSNVSNVLCNGSSTGGINLSVSGGSGSYLFIWSTGATTQNLANLPAGTYSVTVTSNGCASTANATVTEPSPLNANASAHDATCYGLSNGFASIQVSGGTPSYQYTWSNGNSGSIDLALAFGSYTITVTDSAGCSKTVTANIGQPAQMALTFQGTAPSCSSANGSATVSVFGGNSPYHYAWSNGGTTNPLSGLSTGVYTVVVTDANSCTATNSDTLTALGGPSLNLTTTHLRCYGSHDGKAKATIVSGTPSYTYLWNNGQTTDSITNLASGAYTVTVHDGTGCASISSVNVTEPDPITDSIVTSPTVQGGSTGTANLTYVAGGTGAYTYSWSTGQSTQSVSGLPVGTYSVTITDADSCTQFVPFTITDMAGIQNVGRGFKFEIYPNPNNGRFQVDIAFTQQTNCTVEVYNTIGVRVYSMDRNNLLEDNFTIDLTAFPSTTYFVRLVSSGQTLVKKINVFK